MVRWLKSLFGNREFYPFETLILEGVMHRVEGDVGLRLRQQIEVVNQVQRHKYGREVNLYHVKNGKDAFNDELRFAEAPDEELLACVVLEFIPKKGELKADVWMAGGRVFSLEFDKPPKEFFFGMPLENVQAQIINVTLVADLQIENTFSSTSD